MPVLWIDLLQWWYKKTVAPADFSLSVLLPPQIAWLPFSLGSPENRASLRSSARVSCVVPRVGRLRHIRHIWIAKVMLVMEGTREKIQRYVILDKMTSVPSVLQSPSHRHFTKNFQRGILYRHCCSFVLVLPVLRTVRFLFFGGFRQTSLLFNQASKGQHPKC